MSGYDDLVRRLLSIDRLSRQARDQIAAALEQLMIDRADLHRELAAANADAEAGWRYADHNPHCGNRVNPHCICGFDSREAAHRARVGGDQ